jgi:AcrR family transcriptional regulator
MNQVAESPAVRRIGRPPRDEAEDLTAHVVACASALFLDRGYAGTSIEAVAAAARVGKNTIYRRYATKAELFQAVVDQQMQAHLPPLRQIQTQGDWKAGLRQLAIMLVSASVNAEGVALERLVMAEALRFPEIATIYIDRANARATDVARDFLAWIARQLPEGEQPDPEDAAFAAEQLISALVYVPHTFALLGKQRLATAAEIEAYADRALSLFLSGWIGG